MLSLKDIQHVKRESGIYSLLKDGKIVYIGRSRNVYCRILEHIIEGKKHFDNIKCIYHTDEMGMDIMEVLLISEVNPKYNILKIDKNIYLKVLPYECKKHIPDNMDKAVNNLICILSGIEPKELGFIL